MTLVFHFYYQLNVTNSIYIDNFHVSSERKTNVFTVMIMLSPPEYGMKGPTKKITNKIPGSIFTDLYQNIQ